VGTPLLCDADSAIGPWIAKRFGRKLNDLIVQQRRPKQASTLFTRFHGSCGSISICGYGCKIRRKLIVEQPLGERLLDDEASATVDASLFLTTEVVQSGEKNAPFTGIAKVALSSAASNFSPVGCWVAVMLGDIGIAEVSIFLMMVWVSAAAVIATVALYRLHFRKAFAMAAYLGLISLALAVWAYSSIWGYVWAQ
jgi:hypothetical protein